MLDGSYELLARRNGSCPPGSPCSRAAGRWRRQRPLGGERHRAGWGGGAVWRCGQEPGPGPSRTRGGRTVTGRSSPCASTHAKVEEGGEAEQARRRHAEMCSALAEDGEEGWSGPEHAAWTRRIEADHDDLRAALRWSIDAGDAALALRLPGSLWEFRSEAGHSVEGRVWRRRRSLGVPPAARARPLRARAT